MTEQITETNDNPQKRSSRFIWIAIVVIILLFIEYFRGIQPILNKEWVETANEINKSCPMIADANTRLDNTNVLPGDIFQFNYTILNKDWSKEDSVATKKRLMTLAINTLKTNPTMKPFRDDKMTVCFNYRDVNGNYLFKFLITPLQYIN